MIIARSSCSDLGLRGSNASSGSPGEQIRELQRKRTRFGLVNRMSVAIAPQSVKPETVPEATSVCREEADRGGWRRRAEKEVSRNLGGPQGRVRSQRHCRMHKALAAFEEVGRAHSSEEAGNDRGAKGRGSESASNKPGGSA